MTKRFQPANAPRLSKEEATRQSPHSDAVNMTAMTSVFACACDLVPRSFPSRSPVCLASLSLPSKLVVLVLCFLA